MGIVIPEKVIYSSYQEFEEQKRLCKACSVGSDYNCVVCSDGCKEKPIVMVVGEAAGQTETEIGKPFVGKAGKLLRSKLNKFGFRTHNTIITNVIPCRPLNNKFPDDTKMVQECVNRWLAIEISILKPKFIILLGNQPLKYVLGQSGITSNRGIWYEHCGIKIMPTYHPSYVIRKLNMSDGADIEAEFEMDLREVAVAANFFHPENLTGVTCVVS